MKTQNQKRSRKEAKFPSLLDEVLEQRVLLYTLAAGAALAVASPAQAKVIFTPSNVVVYSEPCNGSPAGNSYGSTNYLAIDLNNDGVVDFSLYDLCGYTYTLRRSTIGVGLNLIARGAANLKLADVSDRLPLGLRKGSLIGSSGVFTSQDVLAGRVARGDVNGHFLNVHNRYVGVKFIINGEAHYGWIGFRKVTTPYLSNTAVLGGWAYETVPNKAIRAGDEGEDDSAISGAIEPTSLELLAAGHVAVAERRRRIAA